MELFPVQLKLPEGFFYVEEFISAPEEQNLLDMISETQLHPLVFHGFEAKRKVASFGYDYAFETRTLTKGKEIPNDILPLLTRVGNQISVAPSAFAEVLITEYPVGSVINWHRDAPPFDVIAGVSLSSDCIFKLRPHDKEKQNRKSTLTFTVKRRSLYVMAGVSRYEWQHCTAPVNEVRHSITLRTLKLINPT